jgi:type I restriction enzyme M protein
MDIREKLKEYGYDAHNSICTEIKGMNIEKIVFHTNAGTTFFMIFHIKANEKYEIGYLYDQYSVKEDEDCSLFAIISDYEELFYTKNMKTNQFTIIRDLICYSNINNAIIKPEQVLTGDFENVFFEAHCFLRDLDGLHPDEALDELCKLLYAKLYDEENEDNVFGRSYGNSEEYAVNIRTRYKNANEYDVRVFSLKIPGYKRSRGVFDEKITLSANAIYKVGRLFAKYNFTKSDIDIKARAFQNVYKPTTRSGMGQYFTPLQVIRFIVNCISPKSTNLVIDPFSGSAHFLTETLNYVAPNIKDEKAKHEFIFYKLHGIEKSERMVRIAMTDMRLHGDGHSNIRCSDALLSFDSYTDLEEGMFDVVMTNPPFGSNLQKESYAYLGEFELLREKGKVPLEILGLERSVQLLREGGKLGIVLPDSIFVNKSYKYVREWIRNNLKVRALISLPLTTFTPFGANIKTSVLIATKEKINKKYNIFTGIIENIGFDNKGDIIAGADWQDVSEEFCSFIDKEGW